MTGPAADHDVASGAVAAQPQPGYLNQDGGGDQQPTDARPQPPLTRVGLRSGVVMLVVYRPSSRLALGVASPRQPSSTRRDGD